MENIPLDPSLILINLVNHYNSIFPSYIEKKSIDLYIDEYQTDFLTQKFYLVSLNVRQNTDPGHIKARAYECHSQESAGPCSDILEPKRVVSHSISKNRVPISGTRCESAE